MTDFDRTQRHAGLGTFYDPNFNMLYGDLVGSLAEAPQFICSPRGQKIKEALAVTIVLEDPRARVLNIKARDAQYGFGVGEFLWYLTGKYDLETLLYYNKRAGQFSDDGKTVNSAYGWRMFKDAYCVREPWDPNFRMDQWTACKQTLISDPDSRRAIVIINQPGDQIRAVQVGTKDVPCTLSLQFFIRDGYLDLHVHMRSNDAVWGLTYDLFSFTLFQELMMLELRETYPDLQLGAYYHTAGSMHIYERHFQMAEEVATEYLSPEFRPAAPMEPLVLAEMGRLVEYEEALRTRRVAPNGSSQFSGGVRWLAEQLEAHRRKRDAERSQQVR